MFYLKIQGIAMGTIFAPTYTTLLMGYHEIELYAIIRNKFTLLVSILNKIGKDFRWFFHLFKIKFNKAKQTASYFKQNQTSYTIY